MLSWVQMVHRTSWVRRVHALWKRRSVLWLYGVRRAGKTLTRASLVSGLESMRDVNMGGFLVNYSPKNHEASHYTDLTIIGRGGRFVR